VTGVKGYGYGLGALRGTITGSMVLTGVGDALGGLVRVGAACAPYVAVGMSGTGQVGVADGGGSAVAVGAVGADTATGDGGESGGPGSAVRKSAAAQPSRPLASRTWRQRRPAACCSSPVGMSTVPSRNVARSSPPGVRRRLSPWPPVLATRNAPGALGVAATVMTGGAIGVGVEGRGDGATVGSTVAIRTGAAIRVASAGDGEGRSTDVQPTPRRVRTISRQIRTGRDG
jgi:hypothetical protein